MKLLLSDARIMGFDVGKYEAKYLGCDLIECNEIINTLVIPSYVAQITTEALSQISLILNNSEFYGDQVLRVDDVLH